MIDRIIDERYITRVMSFVWSKTNVRAQVNTGQIDLNGECFDHLLDAKIGQQIENILDRADNFVVHLALMKNDKELQTSITRLLEAFSQ